MPNIASPEQSQESVPPNPSQAPSFASPIRTSQTRAVVRPPRDLIQPLSNLDDFEKEISRAEATKKTVEFQRRKAAEGSPQFQYDLGMRYLKGDGVERDSKMARFWLKASADQSHTLAAKKLAELSVEPVEP